MIDYVSLSIPISDITPILSNNFLVWKETTNIITGEICKYESHYNNMCFKIAVKARKLGIEGSLPKFLYSHNFQDLNFKDLHTGINEICRIIDIAPKDLKIHCFEFGVNVEVLQQPPEIIEGLMLYRRKEFSLMETKGKFEGKQCSLSQIRIKCYDKSKQYNLSQNLLRFEIRVKRMAYIHNKGVPIYTLSDLLNRENLVRLQKILFETYVDIVKRGKIDLNKVKKQKDKDFIRDFRDMTVTKKLTCNTFKYRLKKYQELQKCYKGENSIDENIEALIFNKVSNLIQITQSENLPKVTTNVTLSKKEKSTQSYLLHYVTDKYRDTPITACLECGKSIVSRRKQARTCSAKCRTKLSRAKYKDSS